MEDLMYEERERGREKNENVEKIARFCEHRLINHRCCQPIISIIVAI